MTPRLRRPRALLPLALALAALGCGPAPLGAPDGGADALAPACGDGVLDEGEACDRGVENSDSAPDACRSDCRAPACGDGVKDSEEACDDGNPWGGDGCTPTCLVEEPPFEREPNDDPAAANRLAGAVVRGALREGDRDCFAIELPDCAAVEARLLPACVVPATITLVDPEGREVATGGPGEGRCAALDPVEAPGARFVTAGTFTVCVRGLLGAAVPFYALQVAVVDPKDATYPLPLEEDRDGDGLPPRCDPDRDGDGIDDEADNCPDVPNGPGAPPLRPSRDGFLRAWLTAGAFTGRKSAMQCRPTDDNLVGADDAKARPALGDPAVPGGMITWIAHFSLRDRIELLTDYGKAMAPREVYSAVYVRSEAERALTLGVGPDDGARVWLNGDEVLDIVACQGTQIDSSTKDVTLRAGWNTLLIKIYDQGGGWGNFVRFLDEGKPVTDLELSLSPEGAWTPDQSDRDGDGEGDVCDKTP